MGWSRPRLRISIRVRPPGAASRAKVHTQSREAEWVLSHPGGRWLRERRTSTCGASATSTTNSAVPGGPSGIRSPGARSRTSSGSRRSALGQLPGKRRRSTHRGVYQPPRCQPTWVSHGHTCSGGAPRVAAWLVTSDGSSISASPGRARARSAGVEPDVSPSRCITAYAPAEPISAATPPTTRGCGWMRVVVAMADLEGADALPRWSRRGRGVARVPGGEIGHAGGRRTVLGLVGRSSDGRGQTSRGVVRAPVQW